MSKKQGEEQTEFVKEEENPSRKYIFQKNTKTMIATIIVVSFLVILLIGLYMSGAFLDQP